MELFGLIILVSVAGILVSTCDLEVYPQGTPDPDFYGRWRDNSTSWRQNTISSNKIVYSHSDGSNYTMEDLTWTAITNTGSNASTFPNGYHISGTITSVSNVANREKGESHGRNYFINEAKNKIWIEGSAGNPYNKQ